MTKIMKKKESITNIINYAGEKWKIKNSDTFQLENISKNKILTLINIKTGQEKKISQQEIQNNCHYEIMKILEDKEITENLKTYIKNIKTFKPILKKKQIETNNTETCPHCNADISLKIKNIKIKNIRKKTFKCPQCGKLIIYLRNNLIPQ